MTEACHIQLVSDLSAEAFFATLRRFVSRRGNPTQIWSDNATCFWRTDKNLKELYRLLQRSDIKESVMNFCTSQSIQWKYCPPTGPHHGSVWENRVKSCKRHLKRVVGETKLTFEEMTTTLCQMEACQLQTPDVDARYK